MSDIFLSASVPDSADPVFGKTADPLRIHAAIRALCLIALGHKRIVWGGHPAITPMIWAACENMGVDYKTSVHLYQSLYFPAAVRPKENDSFGNVTNIEAGKDLAESLSLMRQGMMSKHSFEAGIFVGGKQGVIDEFEMFIKAHPKAPAVILPSTGGASCMLADRYPKQSAPGNGFVDFMGYLANHIKVDQPRQEGAHSKRGE